VSAPLPFYCWEVLRGLVVGLELRKSGEDWLFVGPWQDLATSGISPETMHPLLHAGYVSEQEGCGIITEQGRSALAATERRLWEHGLKWLRSRESRLNTS
jgi:hypothetical protein